MSTKLGGATANVNDDFTAEQDAHHLTEAAKIRTDAKRHKAALNHMKKKASDIQSSVDMEKKAAAGLKKAFPADDESNTAKTEKECE
jgi:hypothetical protein